MGHEAWSLIKQDNYFNVLLYRRGLIALIGSLGLNIVLGLLIFHKYINEPERSYYATSGVTPPIKLKAMAAPNSSSQAILADDPPTDDVPRVIPQ